MCAPGSATVPLKHTTATKEDRKDEKQRRHDHRFQLCQKCGNTWNREVNAACNIVVVARGLVDVDYRKKNENNIVKLFIERTLSVITLLNMSTFSTH